MATVISNQAGATKAIPGTGDFGNLKVLFGTYDITSALSAADIVTFFTAPAGFTPLFGFLQGADIDTGTETLEIDIGISGDTTKYLNSGVISGDAVTEVKPVAGIWMPLAEELFTVVPTAFTSNTDIIGTITAAAQAGGTGVITLVMCGVYQDVRAA
jgi:hypothetical protein